MQQSLPSAQITYATTAVSRPQQIMSAGYSSTLHYSTWQHTDINCQWKKWENHNWQVC